MSLSITARILSLCLLLILTPFTLSKPQPANFDTFTSTGGKHWNGWSQITRIFAFGASYTSTGFNWKGEQPSPGNPLGNPSSYKTHTASNGPNFVTYLTEKYNKSSIQTYDFAWAGSPIPGMVGQVENDFVPHYTNAQSKDPGWNPSKTLFVIFTGINDLDHWSQGVAYRDNEFKQYAGAIDTLYSIDARNFVIYTVPPLDQAPEFKNSRAAKKADIDDYNGRIATMLKKAVIKYPDAIFWKINMWALFDQVLDNPAQFPQTKGIKDVSTNCPYYATNWMKLPSMDYKDPSCPRPVNQYAWLNGRHVTYPLHDLLAKVTVDALESS